MSNLVEATTTVLTMSSREIAAVTKKEHRNVTADIRKMLSELGEDVLKFQHIYLDSMKREQVEYRLDRELTDTLLTGYSAVLRRKVIARWHELEVATVPRIAYSVGATDTLTKTEQDELRSILTDGAQALPLKQQGPFLMQGWSKLKAHFKVPYREIPRSEFSEALSIAARHVADGQLKALSPPETALNQAIDSMQLMAGSVADLAFTIMEMTKERAAQARGSPPRPQRGEARAGESARTSAKTPTPSKVKDITS